MTMRHRLRSGSARRGLASISAAALLSTMLAAPAFADHYEDTTVLDGDNAIEAALAWSDATFDTADAVVIGRDDVFADNLASGLIQGLGDGVPLLLTDTAELDAAVSAEIDDLGATVAHVLGGEEAISADVEDELEALGLTIHRHAGATRIETAIDIASKHAADSTSAILARAFGGTTDPSQAFADSLAAGAWAAESGMPVLLTQTAELNENLAAYLETSDITDISIVGGTSAVSAAVAAELESMGITVDRVSGATRFETAVAIAAARGFDDASDATEVVVVEGQDADSWAGGFAGAAYSALNGAPIVLGNGDSLPAPTEDFLAADSATLVCGPLLAAAACDAAAEALGLDLAAHTNQTFTVTPAETAVNTVSDNAATSTANRGARTYTVSGLDSAKTYDLELHEADDVNIDADGNVTFDNNTPATTGSFEVVNGAGVGTAGTSDVREVHNVTPVNGSITFTVDSTTATRVIPVVNEDADADNTLDLEAGATATTPKAPTEKFGIGGEKEWIPAEALGGDVGAADETVSRVNKTNDYFTTGDGTYYYDANDTFKVITGATGNEDSLADCTAAGAVSLATFEASLSTGDELDQNSNYAADPEGASSFCLEDRTPIAVAGVSATELDADSIEVQWGAIDANASEVRVYRKSGACTGTLTDYTKVATLARTATKYQDDGLNASSQYCYVVTQVVDGDESAISNQDDATTTAVGATAAPQSTDAFVQTDGTFQDEVSAGDVWRIIFDKQMAPVDDNDTIRLQDAQGEILNVVCEAPAEGGIAGEEADCSFNTGDVTIAGTTYPAGRVLTVAMDAAGDFTADNTVTGANDRIEYPATISNQSGFTDLGGRAWTPSDDPDNSVDKEGTKTETGTFGFEAVAPDATDAGTSVATTTVFGDAVGETITVTYDEAVIIETGDTVSVDQAGDNATVVVYTCGTNISCSGSGTTSITLTVTNVAAGDVTVTYGTTTIDASTGITDFQGNAAGGYPEAID